MAKKALTLRWSREANANFLEILEHLSKESETAVQIVGNAILDETERLRYTPFMYAADPLKTGKDKNFRSFTVFSYRIPYYVDLDFVYILRIRHSSREPLTILIPEPKSVFRFINPDSPQTSPAPVLRWVKKFRPWELPVRFQ